MTILRPIIITLSALCVLLGASLVNLGLSALPDKGGSGSGINHALIIGISNYDSMQKLKSPSRDAKEIARILTEKYDFKKQNVVLLTDGSKEKPTRSTILTYLDKYVRELTDKENLLIYYSGHSTEDDRGETYWIPKDGKKNSKFSWLRHSDLAREFFGSEAFKVKNLCIITDSLFSKKLIRSSSIVLSPYDLRYPEKIREKARKRSREVIAFGDQHWPASKTTQGYGLFAYYFRKVLMDSWFKVIDLENLLFDEKIIFQVSKIAGTRMLRGRLRKSPMEKKGQTVITRVISPPVINIVDAYSNPKKGYVGDRFIVEAKTSGPAYEVYLEMAGKKYLMDGEGTDWKHSMKIASLGPTPFKIIAVNEDDMRGKPKTGQITTLKPLANMVNVLKAAVSPRRGVGGDEFSFTANTDKPAKSVAVVIEGKRYEMTGSGTNWSLKSHIEDTGSVDFSVIARNEDGLEGRSKGGIFLVKAPKINIVAVETAPGKGYAGDEFLITASTDHPASSVSLKMGGVTYNMAGAGKKWTLKRKIQEIGKKTFTVIATNAEGIDGLSKGGEVLTSKRPVGIPDIATVALSPGKVYAGESFLVKVKTSAAAKEVFFELEGKKHLMDGSGTDWKYTTQIASIGTSRYKLSAKNSEGKQGQTKEGQITTTKKVAQGVDVAKVAVSPKQGGQGQTFTFRATTAAAAKGVTAVIGDKQYKMAGSGTSWSLKKKIEDLGTIDFYVIATSKEGVEGATKGGTFTTKALLANVIDVKTSADKGFVGEEFQFTATTDRAASSVSLQMDGVTYEMTGSGTDWTFKRKIQDIGKKTFTVTAVNVEGAKGSSKSGEILASLAIPDVATVALNPKEIFAGDSFEIKVKTNHTAEQVFVEVGGKKYTMEGAGTNWRYATQIASIGTSNYKVTAQNKEGIGGQTKEGVINALKKPAALINVAKAEVSPGKGFAGGKFTFKASTDKPAKGVTLSLGGKNYKMEGSGTEWSLTQVIKKTGDLAYSISALNEDNVEGGAKPATFIVEEIKKRFAFNKDGTITDRVTGEKKERFVDNGDGTITDVASNLMWLKSPKQIAVTYEDADEYVRKLKVKNYTGWRLPTLAEWKRMIDKKQRNPALPKGHLFDNIVTHVGYWTKTKHRFGALYVYQVNLYNGKTGQLSKKKFANVWPVRYAEIQQAEVKR